jgi:hypothetical protein
VKKVGGFYGRYRFLSNFCPCKIEYGGIVYPSVEHAYQALKFTTESERKVVAVAKTAAEAKRLGRKAYLPPEWGSTKRALMARLLAIKFSQEPFRGMLLATGNVELVEENNWGDRYWGVCGGCGENVLGKLLMAERKLVSLDKEARP